jgi:hypothetical protein
MIQRRDAACMLRAALYCTAPGRRRRRRRRRDAVMQSTSEANRFRSRGRIVWNGLYSSAQAIRHATKNEPIEPACVMCVVKVTRPASTRGEKRSRPADESFRSLTVAQRTAPLQLQVVRYKMRAYKEYRQTQGDCCESIINSSSLMNKVFEIRTNKWFFLGELEARAAARHMTDCSSSSGAPPAAARRPVSRRCQATGPQSRDCYET